MEEKPEWTKLWIKLMRMRTGRHVYPIFPIPEAKPAVEKVIEKIMR